MTRTSSSKTAEHACLDLELEEYFTGINDLPSMPPEPLRSAPINSSNLIGPTLTAQVNAAMRHLCIRVRKHPGMEQQLERALNPEASDARSIPQHWTDYRCNLSMWLRQRIAASARSEPDTRDCMFGTFTEDDIDGRYKPLFWRGYFRKEGYTFDDMYLAIVEDDGFSLFWEVMFKALEGVDKESEYLRRSLRMMQLETELINPEWMADEDYRFEVAAVFTFYYEVMFRRERQGLSFREAEETLINSLIEKRAHALQNGPNYEQGATGVGQI